ncbi:MAG: 50S ribosomal protein L10 [Candidatus Levybacteria bacterium]|nr:50S ribosomal protein L10 [Candidatus Levybacteria bacterium]
MSKKARSKAPVAKPLRGRKRKEEVVAMLSEKAAKAKGLVFTNYQGLTHQQMESLKKAVRTGQAEYIVTKNTLLKRSLEKLSTLLAEQDPASRDNLLSTFQQPTATLFLYEDIIEPLKQVAKTIKELTLPHIKFGFIEGRVLTADEVVKLASLPPVPVLRAKLLGQMMSPITGLHRALNWNIQKLVMTLNAIAQKKQ